MKNIPVDWFKHLPPEEQEAFKESLRANHRILSRLRDIVQTDIQMLAEKEETENEYDGGYPYKQAFFNGKRASLRHIINLLSFLEE